MAQGDLSVSFVGHRKAGEILVHGGVQVDLALLDQLHDRDGAEHLGDGRHVVGAVGGGGLRLSSSGGPQGIGGYDLAVFHDGV